MLNVEFKILDSRLSAWGFPHYGSEMAAGLDLHACIDERLRLPPQAAPVLISAGFAFRINDPEWCALILPRSGLGHREGLVMGNAIGVIDADYGGTCLISAWNRNPRQGGVDIVVDPGDRIAQLVFTRIGRPRFNLVETFSGKTARGAGGFGSTGIAAPCSTTPGRSNSA